MLENLFPSLQNYKIGNILPFAIAFLTSEVGFDLHPLLEMRGPRTRGGVRFINISKVKITSWKTLLYYKLKMTTFVDLLGSEYHLWKVKK